MFIVIIILVGYVLPGILSWRYLHIAHSKGGVYEALDLCIDDVLSTIVPIFNIIGSLLWVAAYPKKKSKKRFDKFFKIKK